MNVQCGKTQNAICDKLGNLYIWGKGEFEKPKFEDFIQYSKPFPFFEEKSITYVTMGLTHAMAIDKLGRLYCWGSGAQGCQGFSNDENHPSIVP